MSAPRLPDLPTQYQQVTHATKYSRWRDDLGRRERWPETVDRYLQFFSSRLPDVISDREMQLVRRSIGNIEAIPSMRALMTAGPALEKDEVAGYNCSYLTMSRPQAFDEIMYILMCGTGVGYSVERQYVDKLPVVPDELHSTDTTIVVADSKLGWAASFRQLLNLLWTGYVPLWDLSKVRPSGSILKTFGGRASGPEPLERLMRHTVQTFQQARGRRLTTKEVHSIVCMIADIVVVGGVRRSAMICLFDHDDDEMMHAKSGAWHETHPHFAMANNSAVWDGRPSSAQYFSMMTTLIRSQSGEPGVFNRESARRQAERSGRDADWNFGLNPCGEIILRDREFCNLSEAIARPDDEVKDLKRKVKVAAILGTWQSTLTSFRYLSPQWQRNCEDERLLGVSIQGNFDHPLLSRVDDASNELREELREIVVDTNAEWAERLSINATRGATCLKPAGNSSQLSGASPPLKPWHGPYFIRRTRGNKNDPTTKFLMWSGVPHEDEALHPDTTVVFSWPREAPAGAKTRHDVTALEQLELWLAFHEHWCHHNPSVTINARDEEWPEIAAFVWRHWDKMSGVAFLPDEDHVYQQAPYEEVDKATYEELRDTLPTLRWEGLSEFESEDLTTGHRELACSAGGCET